MASCLTRRIARSSVMNETRPPKAVTPIGRLVRPFHEFASQEASGGILLISCTVVALIWANSSWSGAYFHLWHAKLLSQPLHFWINDGLMALFFFLVGLEIKRETLVGELASLQKAALPIAAALGGMMVPAGLYVLWNHGGPGAAGWASRWLLILHLPSRCSRSSATACRHRLRFSSPRSLSPMTSARSWSLPSFTLHKFPGSALVATLFFAALVAANRTGTRHPSVYAVLGVGLWLAFLQSGIHATVAGVLLAVTIPARQSEANKESLMLRFEHGLMPWNKWLIMPVFALANAGVILGADAARSLTNQISLGVICGLVFGKPIGIVLFSWLATRSRLAAMLDGVSWRQVVGVGMLAGIGFTMSLFIANLAFGDTPALETAKVGILAASVTSAVAGVIVLVKERATTRPAVAINSVRP